MRECYICQSTQWLERHHAFGGALRKTSEYFGLVYDLCHYCHNEPPFGVHFNKGTREKIQMDAQKKFERDHPELRFTEYFYKNYL